MTLTTIGYGDFTPANDAGRACAILEGLLGQVFLVTIVALVVTNLGQERRGTLARSAPTSADSTADQRRIACPDARVPGPPCQRGQSQPLEGRRHAPTVEREGPPPGRGHRRRTSAATPISRIASSPATRCIETVAPLARALGLEVEADNRLAEGADPRLVLELVLAARRRARRSARTAT